MKRRLMLIWPIISTAFASVMEDMHALPKVVGIGSPSGDFVMQQDGPNTMLGDEQVASLRNKIIKELIGDRPIESLTEEEQKEAVSKYFKKVYSGQIPWQAPIQADGQAPEQIPIQPPEEPKGQDEVGEEERSGPLGRGELKCYPGDEPMK
jgi:hypothetical protein